MSAFEILDDRDVNDLAGTGRALRVLPQRLRVRIDERLGVIADIEDKHRLLTKTVEDGWLEWNAPADPTGETPWDSERTDEEQLARHNLNRVEDWLSNAELRAFSGDGLVANVKRDLEALQLVQDHGFAESYGDAAQYEVQRDGRFEVRLTRRGADDAVGRLDAAKTVAAVLFGRADEDGDHADSDFDALAAFTGAFDDMVALASSSRDTLRHARTERARVADARRRRRSSDARVAALLDKTPPTVDEGRVSVRIGVSGAPDERRFDLAGEAAEAVADTFRVRMLEHVDEDRLDVRCSFNETPVDDNSEVFHATVAVQAPTGTLPASVDSIIDEVVVTPAIIGLIDYEVVRTLPYEDLEAARAARDAFANYEADAIREMREDGLLSR